MENKGLIFIPDISGFTQFISTIELEHSQYIIQQLLELLIDSNELGLEISEIEGDAILFFKFGDFPDLKLLYAQVEKMYLKFHSRLKECESLRTCSCNACINAINLSLKVITHYGEFTTYKVKEYNKLIGKDVIVAHRLLKNNIPSHEYWLVTENIFNNNKPESFKTWMTWENSIEQIDTGKISFYYTPLTTLKNELS